MKPHLHLVVAAPFLAFSAFMLFGSAPALVRASDVGWERFVFTLVMVAIMAFFPGVLGVLALKRRWAEFVKISAAFAGLIVFGLLSRHTRPLAPLVNDLCLPDYPLAGALWSVCVVVAPFVICLTAYKRFVPLIVRRITKEDKPAA